MTNNKITTANSLILGLFLSSPMLTKLITSIVVINNNIVFLIGALLALTLIINRKIKITLKFVFFNICIFAAFFLSLAINRDVTYTTFYFLNYILYGTAGMLFCSVDFNHTKVMQTISVVFVLFTVLTLTVYIPKAADVAYVEESMDISYTIVIGMSASIFVWKHCKNLFRILLGLAIFVSCYYLIFLSDSRGAILALIFLFGSFLLKRTKHKVFWTVILGASVLFILSGWDSILEALANSNSDMRWIIRFRRNSDVLNGRSSLSFLATELINNNMLGKGIGYFETIAHGQYTHNIFLQLMCEFGIFVGGAASIYLVYVVMKSYFSNKSSEFEIFCICQFIPKLLLSSVHWLNPFIWVFLYYQGKKPNEMADNTAEKALIDP